MASVVCPFKPYQHPDTDASLSRINRRWLRRNTMKTESQGGRLEVWDDDSLIVDTYSCPICASEGLADGVKAFGYSRKYNAYVCLFHDGTWKRLPSQILEAM